MRRSLPFALGLAVACGSPAAPGPSSSPGAAPATAAPATASPVPVEAPAPDEAAGAPAAAPGRYEVHEWGLVDVTRDGHAELAAGPGRNPQPVSNPRMQTRKPVLYFHLLEGEVDLGVTATMGYGAMLETFPGAPPSGRAASWALRVVDRACAPVAYPSRQSPRCQGVSDGYCEAAELRAYEASDASCLVVDGVDYNYLFYRGGGQGLTLPVQVEGDRTAPVLRNTGSAPIGFAMYVVAPRPRRSDRSARGRTPLRLFTFEALSPGQAHPVGEEVSALVALQRVRAELARLGLTEPEVRAFLNAWERPVFRAPNVGEAVVYLLPPSAVEAVSTLAFDPPPESVKRAMMVRVEL